MKTNSKPPDFVLSLMLLWHFYNPTYAIHIHVFRHKLTDWHTIAGQGKVKDAEMNDSILKQGVFFKLEENLA